MNNLLIKAANCIKAKGECICVLHDGREYRVDTITYSKFFEEAYGDICCLYLDDYEPVNVIALKDVKAIKTI